MYHTSPLYYIQYHSKQRRWGGFDFELRCIFICEFFVGVTDLFALACLLLSVIVRPV